MKSTKPIDTSAISLERQRIAKILKAHIEKAIDELGPCYTVTLHGGFDTTPIRIEVEVSAQEEEIP